MAITYPITFPTGLPISSVSYGLNLAQSSSRSPFSLTEQVFDWGGNAWEMEISFSTMTREQSSKLNAFIGQLKGKIGTFSLGIPGEEQPQGSWTGSPTVKTISNDGVLQVTGLSPSTSGIIKAGDWLQIGSRLYQSVVDGNTNGGGDVDIHLSPKASQNHISIGEVIIINSPVGLWRLSSVKNDIATTHQNIRSMSLSLRQAQ